MDSSMNRDENVKDAVAATNNERLNRPEPTTLSCFGCYDTTLDTGMETDIRG